MQFDYRPGKIIAKKGVKYLHSRKSGNRETITVITCVCAMDNSLPVHFIIKGKTNRSLNSFQIQNAPEGSTWGVFDSGGLSRELHFSGLRNHFFQKLVLTDLNY